MYVVSNPKFPSLAYSSFRHLQLVRTSFYSSVHPPTRPCTTPPPCGKQKANNTSIRTETQQRTSHLPHIEKEVTYCCYNKSLLNRRLYSPLLPDRELSRARVTQRVFLDRARAGSADAPTNACAHATRTHVRSSSRNRENSHTRTRFPAPITFYNPTNICDTHLSTCLSQNLCSFAKYN